MSEFGSKRLVKKAIDYAIANNKKSVTLVHKGNIMKFTEGSFKRMGLSGSKRRIIKISALPKMNSSKVYNGKFLKGKLVNKR